MKCFLKWALSSYPLTSLLKCFPAKGQIVYILGLLGEVPLIATIHYYHDGTKAAIEGTQTDVGD